MKSHAAQQRLLATQLRYYRIQAEDWFDWVERKGRFAKEAVRAERWLRELDGLREALRKFRSSGDVIEIACGPGTWTGVLAETADSVTVLDAAEEMLVANQQRCQPFCAQRGIDYRVINADIFRWIPDRRYDTACFCFWLSHVPEDLFDVFWLRLARALRRNGRFFFVDTGPAAIRPRQRRSSIVVRRARDGRHYRIVQELRDARNLQERLRVLGFKVRVSAVGRRFVCGSGRVTKAVRMVGRLRASGRA